MIPIKTESIPGMFWDGLGSYVYGYKDKHGDWDYIGKGVGNRVLSHIKTKGFDIENAWIIASNLEDFDDGTDGSAHALETLLIINHKPKHNSVSGRYQENITMTSLRGLITQYQDAQRNNHTECAELLLKYPDQFSTVGQVSSTTSGWKIISKSLGRSTYVTLYQDTEEGYKLEVQVGKTVEDGPGNADSIEESLRERLDTEVFRADNRTVQFFVEGEEESIQAWADLTGA